MKNLMNKFQKSQTKLGNSQESQSNKNKNNASKKSLKKKNERASFGNTNYTNTNETESYKNTDVSRMKASSKSILKNYENLPKETITNSFNKPKNYYGVQLYYQGCEKREEKF
jgi:hypothetical protein